MPIHSELLFQIESNDPSLTEVHISNTIPPLTALDMKQLVEALKKIIILMLKHYYLMITKVEMKELKS